MSFLKRIFLFGLVNILIIVTISTILSILGVGPYLDAQGMNYQALFMFCLIWGFAGALMSLAMSRIIAKWSMGVKVIDPNSTSPELHDLVSRIHTFARDAGLSTMPEVGIYDSPELNAFATGPTRNRSLVAVSTGLLRSMSSSEVDGVLAHEISHIANGDMVTMTLLQGVVNVFVMFFARILAFVVSQSVDENRRGWVSWLVLIAAEIALGFLGMLIVAAFSRRREFRADAGSARIAGPDKMIAALRALQRNYGRPQVIEAAAAESSTVAALKIFGLPRGGLAHLFATHPSLDERIAAVERRLY